MKKMFSQGQRVKNLNTGEVRVISAVVSLGPSLQCLHFGAVDTDFNVNYAADLVVF